LPWGSYSQEEVSVRVRRASGSPGTLRRFPRNLGQVPPAPGPWVPQTENVINQKILGILSCLPKLTLILILILILLLILILILVFILAFISILILTTNSLALLVAYLVAY